MSLFTVSQVVTFGAEQGWKPQNKNAYKRFVKRFALPRPVSPEEKFKLSKAMAFAYEYLAKATQEERERLAAMPDQIEAWQQMKGRAEILADESRGSTRHNPAAEDQHEPPKTA
jgi:hypothetical protein